MIAKNPHEFAGNSNRRAFLKKSSLTVAAVAAGSAAVSGFWRSCRRRSTREPRTPTSFTPF